MNKMTNRVTAEEGPAEDQCGFSRFLRTFLERISGVGARDVIRQRDSIGKGPRGWPGVSYIRRETEHSSTPSFACRCNRQAYRAGRGAGSIGADLISAYLRAEFAEQIENVRWYPLREEMSSWNRLFCVRNKLHSTHDPKLAEVCLKTGRHGLSPMSGIHQIRRSPLSRQTFSPAWLRAIGPRGVRRNHG